MACPINTLWIFASHLSYIIWYKYIANTTMFEETVYKLQLEYHQQGGFFVSPFVQHEEFKRDFLTRAILWFLWQDFMMCFFCSQLLWPLFLSQQNADITVLAELPSLSPLNPGRIWKENSFFSLLHQPLKMPWIPLLWAHPFSNESPPEHWGAPGADWKSRAAGVCALSTWFSSAFFIHRISQGVEGRGQAWFDFVADFCPRWQRKLLLRGNLERAGFEDHRISESWDHGITGSWDHRITGSWDHGITGSQDHRIMGSRNHRITE